MGGIQVFVHPRKGEIVHGMLHFRNDGPRVVLRNGDVLEDLEGVTFSVVDSSAFARLTKIDLRSRIMIKPDIVVGLNYSPKRISGFQMYPPSTGEWLRHVVDSGEESIFTVQKIVDDKRALISIVGEASKEVYFAGLIQPYESSILAMERDWDVLNDIYYSEVSETDVFKILEEKPISWPTISCGTFLSRIRFWVILLSPIFKLSREQGTHH